MTRDVVVVGASMGGVEALRKLAASLPRDFPATIAVVLHLHPRTPSVLPQILAHSGPLPASHAVDGQKLERGHIYVAPPDRHLLLEGGRARVTSGPPENGNRPAVDPLFRSAAAAYRSRAIGVVLSGMLDAGSVGLLHIHRRGGLPIVQDPEDAISPDMPRHALELVPEALRVRADDLGAVLANACTTPTGEVRLPEDVLDSDPADGLEDALWTSLRLLNERADMAQRLADRERQAGHTELSLRFAARASEYKAKAERVREALLPGTRAGTGADRAN